MIISVAMIIKEDIYISSNFKFILGGIGFALNLHT